MEIMTPEEHIIEWARKNKEYLHYRNISKTLKFSRTFLYDLINKKYNINGSKILKRKYNAFLNFIAKLRYYPLKKESKLNKIIMNSIKLTDKIRKGDENTKVI